MNIFRKIIRFLGSIYFAIMLISFTTLFVIGGTFLESFSGSHLFAARFTYRNPVFIFLLALYFLNILISALRRYPFQKKHIPFLITHLGLLMILLGVMIKNLYGIQGSLGITEGSGTSRLFLSNTFALQIENKTHKFLLPLKKGKLGPLFSQDGIKITILEWIPHSEEKLEGFIKGDQVHLIGLPSIPLTSLHSLKPYTSSKVSIYGVKDCKSEEIAFPGHASLFFLQDHEKNEKIIAFNEKGARFEQLLGQSYFIFDKGFGGYAVFVELPLDFPQIELMALLTRKIRPLPLHKKMEDLNPRIRLLVSHDTTSEIVTLSYDRYGSGFKWPALKGKWLFRFQSEFQKIPYHVRLHEAREIRYPASSKPFSFESDLSINQEMTTISMNHVFEKKGYRFYMANLVEKPFCAKKAMIVVNYDPAKKILTYPGAILVALGIILLYFRRLYV